jgi:hypothetical protein
MEASPPIAGEDAELRVPNRHRRAISLIALSVLVIVASGLAYLHPPSISKSASTEPAAESQLNSAASSIDFVAVGTPPITEVFRSPAMHYEIKFPVGWIVTPATQTWRGEWDTWAGANVDHLNGTSVVFTGTSEPLAWGQSPAKWIAWYLAAAGANTCGVQEYMDFLGLTGLIYLGGCTSTDVPGQIYRAAVVVGGRGYSFSIKGQVDHAFFVSMLRTISFLQ